MTDDPNQTRPRRLRIGMYTPTLPVGSGKKGGVEAGVHRLAQALTRRGIVEVTCFGSPDRPSDALYRHRRTLGRLNRSLLARMFLGPLALNFVDLRDYDVVHFNGDDWFYLGLGKSTVRTYHGTALSEARMAATLKRRLFMYLAYGLERLSARLRPVRISIGSDSEQIYRTTDMIGHIVELDRFAPRDKFDHPAICYIGLWKGRKRGAFVYETFLNTVLPACPEAILYMVSDECPLHPSVQHLPRLDDDQLADLLARCWVFAYPSSYEGFGIPYVEAMASGTMVIASPNPGALDQLGDDQRFGQICDDADFGPAVVAALRDDGLRADYARRGLDRARNFSADVIAARYEAVYRAAAERHR